MTHRILLVDDHNILREGLRRVLDTDEELEVVAEAADGKQALEQLDRHSVGLAILDLELPDVDGVELCREIRSRWPEVNCVMLTGRDDDESMMKAIMAGASGYLLKNLDNETLRASIKLAAQGGSLIESATAIRVLEHVTRRREGGLAGLTEREGAILELVAEGLSNREIAQRLFLAEKTVRNNVSNILAKLGVRRRTEAAIYLIRERDP